MLCLQVAKKGNPLQALNLKKRVTYYLALNLSHLKKGYPSKEKGLPILTKQGKLETRLEMAESA